MPIYRTYIPQPPLATFVDKFWWYEGNKPTHVRERRLPDGAMELVVNLREDATTIYGGQAHNQLQRLRGCVISGAHSEFSILDTANLVSVVGVHFKPGGAFPFFRLPLGELHNKVISLDDLWRASANDLRDRLLEARRPESGFLILEQALLARLAQLSAWYPTVAFALKEFQSAPHIRTVSQVTGQIHFSSRHFIQVFREAVGLTPKLFCRVSRFQEVLHLIGRGQQIDWTDVALSCGYFDQAHCIHDFRAFSGLSPGAYLAHRSEPLNHIPLYND